MDTGNMVLTLILSFVITWSIGLAPPLLIRHVFLKRSINKWPAIGICILFWIFNYILFTAMGSESKTHAALLFVAFASYYILRKGHTGNKMESVPPTAGDT